MIMTPVTSSNIESIGYIAEKQELFVKFKNCKTFCYKDVSALEARELTKSASVGRHFSQYIKAVKVGSEVVKSDNGDVIHIKGKEHSEKAIAMSNGSIIKFSSSDDAIVSVSAIGDKNQAIINEAHRRINDGEAKFVGHAEVERMMDEKKIQNMLSAIYNAGFEAGEVGACDDIDIAIGYEKEIISLVLEAEKDKEKIKLLRDALELVRPETYYNQDGEEVDAGGFFVFMDNGSVDNEAMQQIHEALEATKDGE